jgi:hypothetical protein
MAAHFEDTHFVFERDIYTHLHTCSDYCVFLVYLLCVSTTMFLVLSLFGLSVTFYLPHIDKRKAKSITFLMVIMQHDRWIDARYLRYIQQVS